MHPQGAQRMAVGPVAETLGQHRYQHSQMFELAARCATASLYSALLPPVEVNDGTLASAGVGEGLDWSRR